MNKDAGANQQLRAQASDLCLSTQQIPKVSWMFVAFYKSILRNMKVNSDLIAFLIVFGGNNQAATSVK